MYTLEIIKSNIDMAASAHVRSFAVVDACRKEAISYRVLPLISSPVRYAKWTQTFKLVRSTRAGSQFILVLLVSQGCSRGPCNNQTEEVTPDDIGAKLSEL